MSYKSQPTLDAATLSNRVQSIVDRKWTEARSLTNQADGTYDFYFQIKDLESWCLKNLIDGGAAGIASITVETTQDGMDVADSVADYDPCVEFGAQPKVTAAGAAENILYDNSDGVIKNKTRLHVEIVVTDSSTDMDITCQFDGVQYE